MGREAVSSRHHAGKLDSGPWYQNLDAVASPPCRRACADIGGRRAGLLLIPFAGLFHGSRTQAASVWVEAVDRCCTILAFDEDFFGNSSSAVLWSQ